MCRLDQRLRAMSLTGYYLLYCKSICRFLLRTPASLPSGCTYT